MNQRLLMALIAWGAIGVIGCSAGGRVVRRDAHGGELAMWGPVAPATLLARELIVEHCAGRYRLVTNGSSEAANTLTGRSRITYECLDSSATASTAAAAMPAAAEAESSAPSLAPSATPEHNQEISATEAPAQDL